MSKVANNEYFAVVQQLRKHHALFAQFWTVGNIVEVNSPKMPTAAVRFDKKTGAGLQFLINPNFWATLNDHDKAFVISHEILHVYFDHGRRSLELDPKIANYAQDVVINHFLVDYFGFDRNQLTFADRYCWIDTMFPGRNDIESGRCFEYYYMKLMEQGGPPQRGEGDQQGEGQPGEGDPQAGYGQGDGQVTVDCHDFVDDEGDEEDGEIDQDLLDQIQDAVEDMMDRITPGEVEHFEDVIAKGNHEEMQKVEEEKKKHKDAGSMAGMMRHRIKLGRVVKKRKWESVVADVLGRYQGMERDIDIELWTRPNRRLAGMASSDDDLILPASVHETVPIRDRVDVWAFQDTSGSCEQYAKRFFKALATIPEDRFRLRLFCFDTKVYETSLKSGELFGFGGTEFQPMENAIQGLLQREPKAKYPQAVFVITDGYSWPDGVRMQAEFPERWHWFLTPGGSTRCIPLKSKVYKLEDYE